ncbi:hypothetical protein HK098_005257 [Nowakowskiella sp. JEL0407]|nr:hypothetical protein HK098_005257 [Nowakowskiella sp. JEL0407]
MVFERRIYKQHLRQPAPYQNLEIFDCWAKKIGSGFCEYRCFLDVASSRNRFDILNWFVTQSSIDLKNTRFYSANAMDLASSNVNLEMLNWWKESGLQLIWTEHAIDYASANELIQILDWWMKSGLQLKWSEDAIDEACRLGKIDSLEWWFKSGLELKYTSRAIECAFGWNQIRVLQWWRYSQLQMKFEKDIINRSLNAECVHCGNVRALEWWISQGLDFELSLLQWNKLYTFIFELSTQARNRDYPFVTAAVSKFCENQNKLKLF